MKLFDHEWRGVDTLRIQFKSLPVWWDLVNSKKKTAEVRLLTGTETRRLERADEVTHIELVHSRNGNRLLIPLLWHGKVGELLGISVWLFCWDPKELR